VRAKRHRSPPRSTGFIRKPRQHREYALFAGRARRRQRVWDHLRHGSGNAICNGQLLFEHCAKFGFEGVVSKSRSRRLRCCLLQHVSEEFPPGVVASGRSRTSGFAGEAAANPNLRSSMESQRYVAGSCARMLQVSTLATAARAPGRTPEDVTRSVPAPADDQRRQRHGRLMAAVTIPAPDPKPRCWLAHLLEGRPRGLWLTHAP
jgi:hypothetical protein